MATTHVIEYNTSEISTEAIKEIFKKPQYSQKELNYILNTNKAKLGKTRILSLDSFENSLNSRGLPNKNQVIFISLRLPYNQTKFTNSIIVSKIEIALTQRIDLDNIEVPLDIYDNLKDRSSDLSQETLDWLHNQISKTKPWDEHIQILTLTENQNTK